MPEHDEKPSIPRPPTGLKSRGRRLWRELHTTGDFRDCPEVVIVIEEACHLADEVERLRKFKAGVDTRTKGYNGQLVSIPEIGDLQRSQQLLLSMLKSIRVDDDDKMSRSQIGRKGAAARWGS